jgi:hypothetical protein
VLAGCDVRFKEELADTEADNNILPREERTVEEVR